MQLRSQRSGLGSWQARIGGLAAMGALYFWSQQPDPNRDARMPQIQVTLLDNLDSTASRYRERANDLQNQAIWNDRAEMLCDVFKDPEFHDWFARVDSISQTMSGKVAFSVKLSSKVTFRTIAAQLFDLDQKTLIAKDSALFETIYGLSVGQRVYVSGQFISKQPYCIPQGTYSGSDSLEYPEFIVRFTKITAAG
ncbi:hypothetical protein PY365_03560 [Roseiarcaceae bacterium H3SJ34-1]|uniref:hypothetical protein n=1 Tax=Terripilifer ovatus TaxID=3032367 RepID=UPI003AB96F66|nr:hypothetical protein [Roseiarcaceae bacterium H3SJ34-1]